MKLSYLSGEYLSVLFIVNIYYVNFHTIVRYHESTFALITVFTEQHFQQSFHIAGLSRKLAVC